MYKFISIFALISALSACTPPYQDSSFYNTKAVQADTIRLSMLDSLNEIRRSSGLTEIRLNKELTAAALNHSTDMSMQNRPWHFGTNGSSPLDRAARVGYKGRVLGETISETYETETETLAAWIEDNNTREVLLDPDATEFGFSWYQEKNGKIWWTLVTGTRSEELHYPSNEEMDDEDY